MAITFNEFTVKIVTSKDSEKPEENGKYFGVFVIPKDSTENPEIENEGSIFTVPLVYATEGHDPNTALGNLIVGLMRNANPEALGTVSALKSNNYGCRYIDLYDIQNIKKIK